MLIYTSLSFISFPLLPLHTSCSPTVLLPGKSVCLLSAVVRFQFSGSLSLLILMSYSPFGILQIRQGKALTWTRSQQHVNKSLALGTENLQYFAQKHSERADAQCLPLKSKQRIHFGSHGSPALHAWIPAQPRSRRQDSRPASVDLLPSWQNLLPKTLSSFVAHKTRKDGCPLVTLRLWGCSELIWMRAYFSENSPVLMCTSRTDQSTLALSYTRACSSAQLSLLSKKLGANLSEFEPSAAGFC